MAATQQERQYEIEIGKRCELGHKVCTDCLGCCCDSNPRVMTDKKGRTLCAACRDVWTAGGQCR